MFLQFNGIPEDYEVCNMNGCILRVSEIEAGWIVAKIGRMEHVINAATVVFFAKIIIPPNVTYYNNGEERIYKVSLIPASGEGFDDASTQPDHVVCDLKIPSDYISFEKPEPRYSDNMLQSMKLTLELDDALHFMDAKWRSEFEQAVKGK